MEQPLISIIVPIYNGEKYLSRCIESLLQQTYKNVELILVNDGSSDSSLAICREYAAKQACIVVIDQQNAGVSTARNRGLEQARGAYVTFVDCDDWVEKEMLAKLYKHLSTSQVDLAMIGYKEISDSGKVHVDTSILRYSGRLKREEMIVHLFRPIEFFSFCYPWGKLFRLDLIRQYQITFNSQIAIGEDRLFVFDYCMHAGAGYCDSDSYYNYYINWNGAMRQSRLKDGNKYLSSFKAMELMRNRNKNSDIAKALNEEYANMLLKARKEQDVAHIIPLLNVYADFYLWHIGLLSLRKWIKLFCAYKLNISL